MAVVSADNLGAFTREVRRPELVDNIFDNNALAYRLKDNHATTEQGGTLIQSEIMVNTGVGGSYDGLDSLKTTQNEFATDIQMNWRHYYEPVLIKRTDQLKNAGQGKVLDITEQSRVHAEIALWDSIGTAIYSDGTANGGKEVDGLRAMVSATSTYLGVNPTNHPSWAASVDTTTNTLTLDALRTQMLNQTVGNQSPTDLIMNKANYGKLEDLITTQMTNNADAFSSPRVERMADAGFPVIAFRGVPAYHDDKSPGSGGGSTDNYLFLLNMDRIELVLHAEDNFMFEGFFNGLVNGQRGFLGYWFTSLNLLCTERRLQGAFTAINPSL
jgi:hypothetical protein